MMKKITLLLVSLFSFNASALVFGPMNGKINNYSPFTTHDVVITVSMNCEKWRSTNGSDSCGSIEQRVQVKEDGSFQIEKMSLNSSGLLSHVDLNWGISIQGVSNRTQVVSKYGLDSTVEPAELTSYLKNLSLFYLKPQSYSLQVVGLDAEEYFRRSTRNFFPYTVNLSLGSVKSGTRYYNANYDCEFKSSQLQVNRAGVVFVFPGDLPENQVFQVDTELYYSGSVPMSTHHQVSLATHEFPEAIRTVTLESNPADYILEGDWNIYTYINHDALPRNVWNQFKGKFQCTQGLLTAELTDQKTNAVQVVQGTCGENFAQFQLKTAGRAFQAKLAQINTQQAQLSLEEINGTITGDLNLYKH